MAAPGARADISVEKGNVGLETYFYPEDGAATQKHGNAALISQIELHARMSEAWSAKLTPFVRLDAIDSHRNIFDAREAELDYRNGRWRAAAGMRSISWSVTESVGVLPHQVVDIINQRDLAADPTGQEKLGAAMATVSYQGEQTMVEAFVLPWFRDRRFPDMQAREHPFRSAIDVAGADVDYTSAAGQWRPGVAIRLERSFDSANVALIQYRGYAPQPLISPNFQNGKSAALYYLIDMSAFTAQATFGKWLLKSETAFFSTALNPAGFPQIPSDYWSTVSGVEYSFVNVFGGSDLGVFAEGLYDSRGHAANGTPFNKDVFVGVRWVANDQSDSDLICGVLRDLDRRALVAQLQYQRRIGTHMHFQMILRTFNAEAKSPVNAFTDDSVAFVRLRHFF
jgi:hypothetical protein